MWFKQGTGSINWHPNMDPVTSLYVCHVFVLFCFLNLALNKRETSQIIHIWQVHKKVLFFARTTTSPVQKGARLSENSQKHTNIVLHGVIDKRYRLYMLSVLLVYVVILLRSRKMVQVIKCQLVDHQEICAWLGQWKKLHVGCRCPQGPVSQGVSGVRYAAHTQHPSLL